MPRIIFEDSIQTKEEIHVQITSWSDDETEIEITTPLCVTTIKMSMQQRELGELISMLTEAYGEVAKRG